MFARGGIGPFSCGASAGVATLQPDEHGPARRVAGIADQPVATLAAAIRKIVAAHCLGLPPEALRQIGCIVRHRVLRNEKGPAIAGGPLTVRLAPRSEEQTSELQSLMRISYAVFCLK